MNQQIQSNNFYDIEINLGCLHEYVIYNGIYEYEVTTTYCG